MTTQKKKKSAKEKRVLIGAVVVAAAIVAGSTFAWFASKDEVTNRLSASANYNVSIVEDFQPPVDWIPGQTVNKDVAAVNTGSVDAFVRMWLDGQMRLLAENSKDDSTSYDVTNTNKTTLAGASFKLYRDGSGLGENIADREIYVEKTDPSSDGSYRVVDTNQNVTITSDQNGYISISDLEPNDYYLIEETPPTGYQSTGARKFRFSVYIDANNQIGVSYTEDALSKDANGRLKLNGSDFSADTAKEKLTGFTAMGFSAQSVPSVHGIPNEENMSRLTMTKVDANDSSLKLPYATYYLLRLYNFEYKKEGAQGDTAEAYLANAMNALSVDYDSSSFQKRRSKQILLYGRRREELITVAKPKRKHFMSLTVFLSAVALIVIGSTMAYFTSKDQTTNKFIGSRFDVLLTETKWDPHTANDVVPGDEFFKNPQITNVERTDGYVYIRVTVPCDTQMVDNDDGTPRGATGDVPMYKFMVGQGTDPETYLANTDFSPKQLVHSRWKLLSENGEDYTEYDPENKVFVYVYAYTNAEGTELMLLTKNQITEPLFDKVKLWNLHEDYDKTKSHNIKVEGFGIQRDIPDHTASDIYPIWELIEGEGSFG